MESKIFSPQWLTGLVAVWNDDEALEGRLRRIGFNAKVGLGVPEEDAPRVILEIEAGEVVDTVTHIHQPASLDWDLRAEEQQWQQWFEEPPGLLALGVAFTRRALQFRCGDYPAMIKDPVMAEAFVRSFAVMSHAYQNLSVEKHL